MGIKKISSGFASTVSVIALLASPLAVWAEGAPSPLSAPDSVIITEIQTGAKTASDEFIELFNPTSSPVDITGWQIRYVNAGGEATTLLATAGQAVLPAGSYYTFYAASVAIGGMGQTYAAGLSKTDKTVGLFSVDTVTCQMVVKDSVAWSSPTSGATKGEGLPLDSSSTTVNAKDKLLQRKRDALGLYLDTGNNYFDFTLSAATASDSSSLAIGATPGIDNTILLPAEDTVPEAGSGSTLASTPIPGCVPAPPETPPPDPSPDPIPDPSQSPDPEPSTPPDDQAPGQGSEDPPEPQAETLSPNLGLQAPAITEIMPDPGSPQTDSEDEFVELYNPNDSPFDLSGYVLETGTTTRHRAVFPSGSIIAPHVYLAFYSIDTGLSLSNSGGQARLLSPDGSVLSQAEEYPLAKESQSWALIGGGWQWTSVPTPNAQNVAGSPVVAKVASATIKSKTAKAKTASAKPKTSSAKTTKKTISQASDEKAPVQNLAAVAPRDPMHPGVLALIAVSALLYGAYEYRRDVANKFYQLRRNREARAALRQSSKGR